MSNSTLRQDTRFGHQCCPCTTYLEAKLARLEEIIQVLEESNAWYGDEEARWQKIKVLASGTEMASRYCETTGQSVPVSTTNGEYLGTRLVPRASLQADHGKRARAAQAKVAQLREAK